jgi:hypothetical protein
MSPGSLFSERCFIFEQYIATQLSRYITFKEHSVSGPIPGTADVFCGGGGDDTAINFKNKGATYLI